MLVETLRDHFADLLKNAQNIPKKFRKKAEIFQLIPKPILLLTFDICHFNYEAAHIFDKDFIRIPNFDHIADSRQNEKTYQPGLIHDIKDKDTFKDDMNPSFITLLVYYASYDFLIDEKVITKFNAKFQSSNEYEIKPYIMSANTHREAEFGNKLFSLSEPYNVNLEVESLQLFHVGKIDTWWDYVNGKLTILIYNMLYNNSESSDKLFKRTYKSNRLFLFECIYHLKKYKQYVISTNDSSKIVYPMSTLKALDILLLKLSYILNFIDERFIPMDSVSFDVTINNRKSTYVINSQYEATIITQET